MLRRLALLLFALAASSPVFCQRIIEYEAEIGSRDPHDPDVWILSRNVKATHEGMELYSDSALLDIVNNNFTAYDNVKIVLSDTTFIYGDNLFYDAETRIVDIYSDTVVFIDGSTVLKSPHLSFDRNAAVASYNTWGRTTNADQQLESRMGYYNTTTKELEIYRKVVLSDSSSRLHTDTLYYNTQSHIASFVSPTFIYSDSTVIYSEEGTYNTETRYSVSTQASRISTGVRILTCDTLHYDGIQQEGTAYGDVVIVDTVKQITCTGRIGVTSQTRNFSYVTDSALVSMISDDDTLYMHADTVFAYNDTSNSFTSLQAYYHTKVFRKDIQGMCDSAYYDVADSLMTLFGTPVVWYENYQCTSDTISMKHDTSGIRYIEFHLNPFVVELVDPEKFNQMKGRRGMMYFVDGEPSYADVLGNAQMIYYITEEDSAGNLSLTGVNAGLSSNMRLYFLRRKLHRLVAYIDPDMHTYPLNLLPDEQKRLQGFRWLDTRRPHSRSDVFVW